MQLTGTVAGFSVVMCLYTFASAAMYTIDNPAARISNPADRIYNPASKVNNPAANIYNPASRMNNPDPLSPPTRPIPPPAATATEEPAAVRPVKKSKPQLRPVPVIPRKSYNFKTVTAYLNAAKKAFVQDNYIEFLSITEDALRRIRAGTLKASAKTKQKLLKYKTTGYGFL